MHSAGDKTTIFECQPVFPMEPGWSIVIGLSMLAVVAFSIRMLRQDAAPLSSKTRCLLLFLRLFTWLAIIVFALNPVQRSETRQVNPSKLVVLVDTSLSMGLSDGGDVNNRRIDDVVGWLKLSDQVKRLRNAHEVDVFRFTESGIPKLIHHFPKQGSTDVGVATDDATEQESSRGASWPFVSVVMFGAGLILMILSVGVLVWEATRWIQGVAGAGHWCELPTAGIVVAYYLIGFISVTNTPIDKNQIVDSESNKRIVGDFHSAMNDGNREETIDWASSLVPTTTETRLGTAIQSIVNRESGSAVSGILVMSDGGHNSGVPPQRAIADCLNSGFSLYPVGLGSTKRQKNLQVTQTEAPVKAIPGDPFKVKSVIRSFGFDSANLLVQLVSTDADGKEAEQLDGETVIVIEDDGQAIPIEFETEHQDFGKRLYRVRVSPLEEEINTDDNEQVVAVELIDRKTRVLLIAGGPNRDFRFLRNQLYRDSSVELHVWLQSAISGADQEADVLLSAFPESLNELADYDCIVAFDADWLALDSQQTAALERWVAEQAGGLVVVAGPVNTPEWTRQPRGDESIDRIRALYPVSFFGQSSARLKLGRFGGKSAFPLAFTREGLAASFLEIGVSEEGPRSAWQRFNGVFGYYAVNEPKPGADVLANFADPETKIDDRLPIYLASQFYGAGRVLFQASGEMWRIRKMDVELFSEYYTKIIRWTSQGRLFRDSKRGLLLADREECWVGDSIGVQAILRNIQNQPLMDTEVNAILESPDGLTQSLVLTAAPDAVRPGIFENRFAATSVGTYKIALPIPNSVELEVLTEAVVARIPDLELERPERNDVLMRELAEKTGGHYYVGIRQLMVGDDSPTSPTQLISPRDQVTYLTGPPNFDFQRSMMMWLMGGLTLTLAAEWIFRRSHRLA